MELTTVNKVLGENIESVTPLKFHKWDGMINMFNVYRKRFCEALKKDGYTVYASGNYVTASKGDEYNTFFFAAHADNLTNYLIPTNLANRVQYFAFYDNTTNKVYKVGYTKVREYCLTLKKAYSFAGSVKMFIPDSWARQQILNTYNI